MNQYIYTHMCKMFLIKEVDISLEMKTLTQVQISKIIKEYISTKGIK